MRKRNYRAQKVNEIRWEAVGQRVEGKAVVFAVDVAKDCLGEEATNLP